MPETDILHIDTEKEAVSIISFLKGVFRKTGRDKAVIGWSGGIDSTVSLFLLARALPPENIYVVHMPYTTSYMGEFAEINKLIHLPPQLIIEKPITKLVDAVCEELKISDDQYGRLRSGNIMARLRMILLFDRAREVDGLVCGTENRTEHLLGYFTRYGDGASDIEPIVHLYKTQVYALARYLGVPDLFLHKMPSAGLWDGQTDEGEFGFTYEEADRVCHLHFDLNKPVEDIEKKGYEKASKIIGYAKKNSFKLHVPYTKG